MTSAAPANVFQLTGSAEVPAGAVTLAQDRFHAALRDDHPLDGLAEVDVRDLADDSLLLSTGGCERRLRELYRPAERRCTRRTRSVSSAPCSR